MRESVIEALPDRGGDGDNIIYRIPTDLFFSYDAVNMFFQSINGLEIGKMGVKLFFLIVWQYFINVDINEIRDQEYNGEENEYTIFQVRRIWFSDLKIIKQRKQLTGIYRLCFV